MYLGADPFGPISTKIDIFIPILVSIFIGVLDLHGVKISVFLLLARYVPNAAKRSI